MSDDDDDDGDEDDKGGEKDDGPSNKRKADEASGRAAKKAKSAEVDRTVYCQGLPWSCYDEEISEFFASCGEIEKIEKPLAPDGRSSGTALVTFATLDAAESALGMNGETFGDSGRWIKVIKGAYHKEQTRTDKENTSQTASIFVGNLAWEVDEDTIRSTFQDCGQILSIRFAMDRDTNEFKGFGHIDFDSAEAATKAVALGGTDVFGRPIRCDFATNKRKDVGGGGRGRGGGGGGGGRGAGRGGRGGRNGRGGASTLKKASGVIPRGAATNKKIKF
ncbi:hypothetical protein CTAYLR_006764 [Chrysophaeum taylorii]|uniref:RRM domain-containing protein n=1 Tax=Chrysophaeum taylorii TaxID=2483200 RepID=A0AAD7UBA4_9STRA|nr:hypothetical protein CTAYLR_006764 [Chrysophaeum taylorii]